MRGGSVQASQHVARQASLGWGICWPWLQSDEKHFYLLSLSAAPRSTAFPQDKVRCPPMLGARRTSRTLTASEARAIAIEEAERLDGGRKRSGVRERGDAREHLLSGVGVTGLPRS